MRKLYQKHYIISKKQNIGTPRDNQFFYVVLWKQIFRQKRHSCRK
jgi:hypothetical protein